MIRVIIERTIKRGKECQMWDIVRDLRGRAVRQTGYVSGETLAGYDDPRKWTVISTWLDVNDWREWAHSRERREVEKQERPLLAAPVRTTVWRFFGDMPCAEEAEPVEETELEEELELQ